MEIIIEGIKPCSYYQYLTTNRYRRKYITKKGREYKEAVEDIFVAYMEDKEMIKGNCKLDIVFYFNNKRKNDLDNFIKPVMDFMSDIIYEDDKLVVDLRIRKYVIDKHSPSKIIINVEPLTD